LLTDTPQNLHDFRDCWSTCSPASIRRRSLHHSKRLDDTLDYTSGKVNEGSKASCSAWEKRSASCRVSFVASCLLVYRLRKHFVAAVWLCREDRTKKDPEQASRLAKEQAIAQWPLVVLHDNASVAGSIKDFLWST